jgi:hypothetical protein
MREIVDAATTPRSRSSVPALLVRHLAAVPPAAPPAPAKVRLEEVLGPELAERLLSSLAPEQRPPG